MYDVLDLRYDKIASKLDLVRFLAVCGKGEGYGFLYSPAIGIGTPIRRGLGGTSVIKWSPTGDYFVSGKFDGTFYLWETNIWTSEPWSSASGFVTGATWDPDGRMVLLAFSRSSTLGSIHFASKPPSLDAHLLPIELPEIISLSGSQGIEKIAWDASGERLAVSYKGGDEIYKGLIAVYDTRRNPLISASLIGFVRGPGDNPNPIAFSFHDKFKQGPLLSVFAAVGADLNLAGAVDFAVPTLLYFVLKFFPGQGIFHSARSTVNDQEGMQTEVVVVASLSSSFDTPLSSLTSAPRTTSSVLAMLLLLLLSLPILDGYDEQ
ncbi:hypothetical protein REPUB_Repub06bG0104000 [Reevesia pubescens]